MKKCLFSLMLACISFMSYSQSCVYLGCAAAYTPTTNGSLSNIAAPAEFTCYTGYNFVQVFWQYVYSPTGGNYVQGYSSANSSLDLDWIVFDMGTTGTIINCPISTTGKTAVGCSTSGSAGSTGGPGHEGTVATTAGHYYLIGITYWQALGNVNFTIGAPTIGGAALTAANCSVGGGGGGGGTSTGWMIHGNTGTKYDSSFVGTSDNISLRFRTNNVQRVIFDSTGKVGIGMNAPLYPLDVNGKSRFKGADYSAYVNSFQLTDSSFIPRKYADSLFQKSWGLTGNTGTTAFNFLGTSNNFSLRFRTNNAQQMILDSTGKLGIGMAAPLYPLDVNGSARFKGAFYSGYLNAFQLKDSSFTPKKYVDSVSQAQTLGTWKLSGNTGTNAFNFLGTGDNFSLRFRTNNSQRMILDSTGKLGIGMTAPLYPLDVNGNARFKGATFSGYQNSSQLSDSSFTPRQYIDSLLTAGDYIRNSFYTPQAAWINLIGTINVKLTTNTSDLLNINGVSTSNTQSAIASFYENSVAGVMPYRTHNVLALRAPNMEVGGNVNLFLGKAMHDKDCGFFGYHYGGDTTFGHSAFFFDSFGLGTYPHTFWFDSSYYIGYGLQKLPGMKFGVNGAASFKGAVYAGYTNSSVLTDSSFTPKKYVDSLLFGESGSSAFVWGLTGNTGINPASSFIGTTDGQPLVFKTNNIEALRIDAAGRIGIGTTNINDTSYKLFVEKGIHTRRVKVDITAWSDFVFDNDYRLPTLKEVNDYINAHKHLPDVPSASDVQNNGLDLGTNQAVLLRKIEELTLYAIEQDKKAVEQNKKMEEQDRKLEKQQQQIDELLKLVKK